MFAEDAAPRPRAVASPLVRPAAGASGMPSRGWADDDAKGEEEDARPLPAAAATAPPPHPRRSIVAQLSVGVESWIEDLAAEEAVPEGYAPVGRITGWGQR